MIGPINGKGAAQQPARTPNATSFFRNPHQYRVLCLALERIFNAKSPQEKIRIWVPGCSDGREAYSIAMIIHEKQYHRRPGGIEILATDVVPEYLYSATQGAYRTLDAREEIGIDTENIGNKAVIDLYQGSYFEKVKGRDGAEYFRVKKEIRDMVTFRRDDLHNTGVEGEFDLISCHHVLEHFKGEEKVSAARTLLAHLRPGGFLATNEEIFAEMDNLAPIDTPYPKIGYNAYQLKA